MENINRKGFLAGLGAMFASASLAGISKVQNCADKFVGIDDDKIYIVGPRLTFPLDTSRMHGWQINDILLNLDGVNTGNAYDVIDKLAAMNLTCECQYVTKRTEEYTYVEVKMFDMTKEWLVKYYRHYGVI